MGWPIAVRHVVFADVLLGWVVGRPVGSSISPGPGVLVAVRADRSEDGPFVQLSWVGLGVARGRPRVVTHLQVVSDPGVAEAWRRRGLSASVGALSWEGDGAETVVRWPDEDVTVTGRYQRHGLPAGLAVPVPTGEGGARRLAIQATVGWLRLGTLEVAAPARAVLGGLVGRHAGGLVERAWIGELTRPSASPTDERP